MREEILRSIDEWDYEPTQPMAVRLAPTTPEFLNLPPEHWSRRMATQPSPSFNDVDRAAIPVTVL